MNSGRLVDIGSGRFAHSSGALWLPGIATAILADVHLGFGWALRRRGQLGPVDDERTRRKLQAAVEDLAPRTVVFLGDLVHAPRPAQREREAVAAALGGLKARLIVVLGNHDRRFARDYPELDVEVCKEWHATGLVAVHGDKPYPAGEHIVAGHLHPAVTVFDDAGAGHKMPAFVVGENVTLLPAFSAMAAGFDVRSGLPEVIGSDPRIVVATGQRAIDLGPLSRLR